jgi:hypothetical protein
MKRVFGAKFNKRGNAVIDGTTLVVVFVIFGLASIFGYMIFDELNDSIISEFTGAEAQEAAGDLHSNFPALMDGLYVFAFVLFIIFVIVSVFLLDTHPVFFIVSVVMLLGVFVAGMLLSNAFDDVMQDEEVAVYADAFPKITWIMSHLVELIIAIGFLTMLALFAKYRSE